jgi:hypothetical protein
MMTKFSSTSLRLRRHGEELELLVKNGLGKRKRKTPDL